MCCAEGEHGATWEGVSVVTGASVGGSKEELLGRHRSEQIGQVLAGEQLV